MAEVKVGQKVRCRLTGFEGTAYGRTTYLSGCVRVIVVAAELKDGKPVDEWFDEGQLEVIDAEAAEPKEATGGPGRDPGSRPDPQRGAR